jgi:hypothetical protein
MVLNSVTGCVAPRVTVRLEGLDRLKKRMSSGLEPATFRHHRASINYPTACFKQYLGEKQLSPSLYNLSYPSLLNNNNYPLSLKNSTDVKHN